MNLKSNFVKKIKELVDLYINFVFWFLIKMSLDIVTFFISNPLGLSIYAFIFCAGFYSNNDTFFFVFLKLFFSYILVETVFLAYFTKIPKINEMGINKYGSGFSEKVKSLNSALLNVFLLITSIILIDFLTDLLCIWLRNIEVETLVKNSKTIIEKLPTNSEEKQILAERTINTVKIMYEDSYQGVFKKIFSTLFGK